MSRHLSLLFLLTILVTPVTWAETSDTNTPATTATTPEITTPSGLPAITNQPPVTTNLPPSRREEALRSDSAGLLGANIGNMPGKFTLSGRTLKLPAPEAAPRPADAWRRNLDFGMNMTRGNSEILRYELGLDASRELADDFFRVRAKGVYGESGQIKDTENADAGFRYEHMMTKQVYALGNLSWLNDTIAGLRYRTFGIVSPGFRLIRTDTTLLNLETGAGYIAERKTGMEEQSYAAGRAAIRAEHILNAHVLTWISCEYLPKLSDTSVYYMDTETGVSAVLTRDLSLNVCYHMRYDSMPVAGEKSTDSTLTTSLSLNF